MDDADFLNGGDGNDKLVIGQGDFAHGGSGADQFILGDWIDEDGQAFIQDFVLGEDQIIVAVQEDELGSASVTFEENGDTGATLVLLNGLAIASLANTSGLTPDMVTLVAR